MPEFALEMRQISKTYGAVRANEGVSLAVKVGTIHALAGENGAGKSTLMKILFGLTAPDSSSNEDGTGIFLHGKKVKFNSPLDAIRSGLGMVQQHFALAGALSALDNIILGSEPRQAGFFVDRPQAEKILSNVAGASLQVPWALDVDELSIGLQQRIEILKLLFRKAELLILDEPTAVLTPQEVETFFALLRRLRDEGKTIILISHKLHEVLDLCDEVTVLRQGKTAGHFSTQGLTKEKLIQAMIGREIKSVRKAQKPPGEVLLEARDIQVKDRLRGALRGVDFQVCKNEIVGLAGVEGHGQQTLMEALLGLTKFEGEFLYRGKSVPHDTKYIRDTLNFGLISEDRHEQSLWLEASVAENGTIGFWQKFTTLGVLRIKKMATFAEQTLKPYGVKMSSIHMPMKSLSGGNQQKVVVAREVSARRPEFLVASQPTRGVDVGAIEFIHQQILDLQALGAGVLLISSELEEMCALSDRILVFFEGRIAAQFQGPNYDLYKIGQAMISGSLS